VNDRNQDTRRNSVTHQDSRLNAAAAGTFALGGDLNVNRMGFGAVRITGPGIWGEPKKPEESKAVLRQVLEFGINLIDTADSYGPEVTERLIAETLHPYPEGLTIATKGGLLRPGPDQWVPDGRPEHRREACEGSLRRLKVDRIDLYQLHCIDPRFPAKESLGTLAELKEEGKIRYVGLSGVGIEEIERAQEIVPIASVQNRYNLTERGSKAVLDLCERKGLGFIPWFPLANGNLARRVGPMQRFAMRLAQRVPRHEISSARRSALAPIARRIQDQLHCKQLVEETAARHNAALGQVALAWLLTRSPVMLPIPGTSSVGHLKENVTAADLQLSREESGELAAAVP
jgi:pyridoxine 4-dehydrogenase